MPEPQGNPPNTGPTSDAKSGIGAFDASLLRMVHDQDHTTPTTPDASRAYDMQNNSLLADVVRPLQSLNFSGETIGRYTLERMIGSGGMGTVYLAVDTRMSRQVAIKVLRPGVTQEHRFLQEARLLARLNHQHIVQIYEVGTSQRGVYIAMEWVAGESLAQTLAHRRLPRGETVRIMIELADAVGYAHANDIIHRDLKPGNVLLENTSGRTVLLDFGLAKDRGAALQSQTGQLIGTCRYMAPEQVSPGLGKISERTDMWALGAILYEMLVGQYAMPGNSEVNIFHSILQKQPVSPRDIDATIPVGLADICCRALSKDPRERYQNAHEFIVALGHYRPAVSQETNSGRGPRKTKKQRQGASKRRIWQSTAGIIFLVLAAILSWLPARQHGLPRKREPAPTAMTKSFPAGWPIELWQTCWHETQGYLDLTSQAWLDLPASAQAQYARAYQRWYAASRNMAVDKVVDKNGAAFTFCLIPPGKFRMGSRDPAIEKVKSPWGNNYDETPHSVLISKPFYIGTTEVTQAQWLAVMGNDPPDAPKQKNPAVIAPMPMKSVSWEHCRRFCQRASNLRLLTEAEWEYACRAGVTATFCCGDSETELLRYARFGDNTNDRTSRQGNAYNICQVASRQPNAWGVYDMHGNVWEWCQDWYGGYPRLEITDPQGPLIGSDKIARGGSWFNAPRYARSSHRHRFSIEDKLDNLGLRIALRLPESTPADR